MRARRRRSSVVILSVLIVLLVGVGELTRPALRGAPIEADLLLRGGLLYLGDGQPATVGDLAIAGEKIVGVGEFETGKVSQVIDCRGLLVCPGFIDLHNHSDRQVVRRDTRAVVNYLTQGCTTIVTGNCGSGPIDVEDYYQEIARSGAGVNVAHLLPQGALRRAVIGTERRKASSEELARMKELTAEAMRAGAWGLSTGLIYVPSSYADTDELVELAKVVARYGGLYASHIRNENTKLLEAVDEALEIGRRAKLPVHISHFKSSGKNAWGIVRRAAERIERERRTGAVITADQYPYTASSTSLGATLIPSWARAGGRTELLSRLDDGTDGPRIRTAIAAKLVELDGGERLQIASYGPRPEWAGLRLAEIASRERLDPLELVLQMERRGGAAVVNHSIDESDVRHVMKLPWVATASDGSAKVPGPSVPHPRSYGTFPRKIGHYAVGESVIPIEHAIHSATGLPARILGLDRRGLLRTGYWADVVVLDPERIADTATFERPHQFSTGVEHVFVNGRPAVAGGTPTGILSGRALRHAVSGGIGAPEAHLRTRVDELFAAMDKPESPGCALGIVKDGRLIYGRGYGSANLDYTIPIDTDTVFYAASVSKQFVAVCVALLAIDGRLSIDDDVRKHVPELPRYEAPITIRHLIHHTSGLRDYLSLLSLSDASLGDVHTRPEMLELICRQKALNFRPGDRYLYSNSGYFLLAEIVERVAGRSLRRFADERLFGPLGMTSTHFHDDRTHVVRNRALSYVGGSPNEFRMSYLANWDQVGSGGLLTTIRDLVRWDLSFFQEAFGGRKLHDLLLTRGTLNDGTVLDYAFGLVVGTYKGLRTVSHSGSFMGFRTVLLRFPDERFSVILLANLGGVEPVALARKIADLYLAPSIARSFEAYCGRFRCEELGVVYDVGVRGADLVVTHGRDTRALEPAGDGTFTWGGARLEFRRDPGGRVTELRLSTGRANDLRFERVD